MAENVSRTTTAIVKWSLRALLTLGAVVLLELVGQVALRVDALARERRADGLGAPTGADVGELTRERYSMSHESLHPFLGFVQNPDVSAMVTRRGRTVERTVGALGFNDYFAIAGNGAGVREVVILGGSVAINSLARARPTSPSA